MDSRKPLTAGEIEELRELEAKATPGPWRDDHRVGCVAIYPGKKVNCICESEETRIAYWHGAWVGENDGCWTVPEDVDANAALIAAMRNIFPRLLSLLTPPPDAAVREAVAGNGRFADMLESSVADWRKLYAEERAERVRIQHILVDDVQAERQESDEHIKGLNTIIATQDKNIGDLKAHIQRIEVDHDDVEARAESAEARVMAWARGRCCACSGMTEDEYGQRVLYTERCYGCVEYSGDDDAVSLWAPAWDVGE